MLLRYVKVLLAASVAAWGLVAGAMNLLYYDAGMQNVVTVLSMGGADSIRAVQSPALMGLAYAFIYLGKFATGLVCGFGTWRLWQARGAAGDLFNRAKSTALAGCGIALFMLFFGFIVVAGAFFSTGQPGEPLTAAYHQFTLIFMGGVGLIALLIATPDPDP